MILFVHQPQLPYVYSVVYCIADLHFMELNLRGSVEISIHHLKALA